MSTQLPEAEEKISTLLTLSKVMRGSLPVVMGAMRARSKASKTDCPTSAGVVAGSVTTILSSGMPWVLQRSRAVRWSSVSATTVAASLDGLPSSSSQNLSTMDGPPPPPPSTGRSSIVSWSSSVTVGSTASGLCTLDCTSLVRVVSTSGIADAAGSLRRVLRSATRK